MSVPFLLCQIFFGSVRIRFFAFVSSAVGFDVKFENCTGKQNNFAIDRTERSRKS